MKPSLSIRTADLSDLDKMTRVMADIFKDDPINLWIWQTPEAMQPIFRILFERIYMKRGFSHFAGDHAGTIWLEPGVSSEPGLIDTLAVAKTLWKHSGWRGVKAALSMDSIVQKHHPKEPHYYLFMIGAMEQARGQGLGSQLMRHSLERIDGEDMPAYLENSKEANIGFYQMHGFEIMDSVTLPHCPRHGAPVFWPMWRKRRSER